MKLHEYQSKQRIAQFGIPTPPGKTATTYQDVYDIALELNTPVAIKAQLLTKARHKLGGILFAGDAEEAQYKATSLLGKTIEGFQIDTLLVETAYNFTSYIHLAITYDRTADKPVMMAAMPETSDLDEHDLGNFATEHIHPMLGLHHFQARNLASVINLPYEYWPDFIDITNKLSTCYLASDAATLEINPLALTDERGFVALDARMSIDEYALFRQPDLASLSSGSTPTPRSVSAMGGVHFVQLNGCIGCMTNGSGLGMATMDAIQEFGGDTVRPGCLIDLGSDISESRLESGLQKILDYPGITVLLINLFAVVTPCDQTARIVLRLLNRIEKKPPVVIRLAGENASEGFEILHSAHLSHITAVSGFTEAAQKAVDAAQGRNSWLF